MHTLLDLRGSIPSFIMITTGKVNDVKALDELPVKADSAIAMDRGYIDFKRLYEIHRKAAFFVIRDKNNLKFRRLYSREADKTTGLRADQTIALFTGKSRKGYPEHLRRVSCFDKEQDKRFVFLTGIPAKTVADVYKQRRQVELFFKWIKQHLRIKAFSGTSPNAVKTQIWVGLCIYLLAAITKKRLNLSVSLYTFLQIIEKWPISRL